MKQTIINVSPVKLALLFASFGLVISLLGILFLLTTPMKEGVVITLSGFASFTFRDHIDYRQAALYPFVNIGYGLISGFIAAWIFNLWARLSGGLSIVMSENITKTYPYEGCHVGR